MMALVHYSLLGGVAFGEFEFMCCLGDGSIAVARLLFLSFFLVVCLRITLGYCVVVKA
jgi:hypothetical protein